MDTEEYMTWYRYYQWEIETQEQQRKEAQRKQKQQPKGR